MGYTTYTCTCGDVKVADYVDAKGHTYTSVVTEATCTTMGYTTYTCACGDKYIADYVDAKGHTYTSAVTEATCTTIGYTTYTCACGDTYKADITNLKAHTPVEDAAVEPTYSAEGKTAGSHCSVCNVVIDEQEIVPAKSLAWLWITLGFVVVVAGLAVAFVFIFKKDGAAKADGKKADKKADKKAE